MYPILFKIFFDLVNYTLILELKEKERETQKKTYFRMKEVVYMHVSC